MLSNINLTDRSIELLHRRDISDTEINQFQQLLNDAQAEITNSGKSSKQVLQEMDSHELDLLKRANSLANSIQVTGLSDEGAANLLLQPDFSDRVDLNNDGIVEVGIGRSITFPPVNAPDSVKRAWDEATAGMSEGDMMSMQLHMHLAIYGVNIEGIASKTPLPPEQQWDAQHIQAMFADLYGGLEFAVNMDGWTEQHKMEKSFYERFEQALTTPTAAFAQVTPTSQNTESEQQANVESESDSSPDSQLDSLMQLILDARMGLDRRKLDEIEEKIKAIENDSTLDPKTKKAMLEQLETQKQDVLDKARERIEQEEKLRSLQQQIATSIGIL